MFRSIENFTFQVDDRQLLSSSSSSSNDIIKILDAIHASVSVCFAHGVNISIKIPRAHVDSVELNQKREETETNVDNREPK